MADNIFETEFYYKVFDDLPSIPEAFLKHKDFAEASTHQSGLQFTRYSNFSRPDLKVESPEISSWEIPENLRLWIRKKITPAPADVNDHELILYRKVAVAPERNFYPPHVDTIRRFTLIYNIADSGGDVVFWKERDQPIFRKTSPGVIKDYSTLEELCRIKSPHKKWYIINNQVIHSVENLDSARENIQVECFLTDKIVIDSLKPL